MDKAIWPTVLHLQCWWIRLATSHLLCKAILWRWCSICALWWGIWSGRVMRACTWQRAPLPIPSMVTSMLIVLAMFAHAAVHCTMAFNVLQALAAWHVECLAFLNSFLLGIAELRQQQWQYYCVNNCFQGTGRRVPLVAILDLLPLPRAAVLDILDVVIIVIDYLCLLLFPHLVPTPCCFLCLHLTSMSSISTSIQTALSTLCLGFCFFNTDHNDSPSMGYETFIMMHGHHLCCLRTTMSGLHIASQSSQFSLIFGQ